MFGRLTNARVAAEADVIEGREASAAACLPRSDHRVRREIELTAAEANRVMKLIIERLTEALAAEGFVPCPAPDGRDEAQPGKRYPDWRRAWFCSTDGAGPGLRHAIEAMLVRDGSGVGVTGAAVLWSDEVAQIRSELPPEALESAARSVPDPLESIAFGFFRNPQDPSRSGRNLIFESGIDFCAALFMESVRGPVQKWFAQRKTVTDILALASSPNLMFSDRSNPDPVRLRGAVILALLKNRASEAIAVMHDYVQREQYHSWDSPQRVAAFDIAMADTFPAYTHAR